MYVLISITVYSTKKTKKHGYGHRHRHGYGYDSTTRAISENYYIKQPKQYWYNTSTI